MNKRQCPVSPIQVQDPWLAVQKEPKRLWRKKWLWRKSGNANRQLV